MTTRTNLSDGWTLRLAGDADHAAVPAGVAAALPIPATVPGTVHTDLLAAGLIPDPYLDRNELDLDWIGRQPWIYERDLPYGAEQTALVFEGLDTIATVSLNGTVLARTENQHRRYEIPIALEPGGNRLTVRFDSAWEFGEAERARLGDQPSPYPGPYPYLRKMACNFGWDWGPALVTAGIWRPVTLIRHTGRRIAEVQPQVTVDGQRGLAALVVRLDDATDTPLEVAATVGPATATGRIEPGSDRTTLVVAVDEPALWWPHGLGGQPLYDATVTVADDSWQGRIGFRSVRLDTTPDAAGTPFRILVNDVPVPVRGANWIPDDCFPSRLTPGRLQHRVGQARAANINLLRIWGGGIYESADFYRACDEQGVLVWQDFLFACAGYPEEARLAAEIDAEARDNVARLSGHPSLVLWNGNNENIWGWFDWDWQQRLGDRGWGLSYYLDLLPRAVAETDPTRPYWPGSPYSGSMDIHPNDEDHALGHIWDVWNDVDYTVYRHHRPRFVAEFGWQAPPTWSTLTRSVHDDPLTPTSPGMLHHQKAIDGNGKLDRGLAPHLPEPADTTDWHWATQLNQARAVALGIEHFRSLRPRCSGSIVWQLNDCWPVTSWAAIDGDGRKKPLWYALRAAYTPRLLTIQPRGERLMLVAVNDSTEAWHAEYTVRRLSFDGAVLAERRAALAVGPLGARTVDVGLSTPDDPTAELVVADAGTERALWFFGPDCDLAYRPAGLELTVRRQGHDVLLTAAAQTLVRDLAVFPDRIDPAAEADANLVTLLPGERTTIRIHGLPPGREDDLLAPPVLRTANDLVHAHARTG